MVPAEHFIDEDHLTGCVDLHMQVDNTNWVTSCQRPYACVHYVLKRGSKGAAKGMTIKELLEPRIGRGKGQVGKSQAARELGITRTTVDMWLSGQQIPDPWPSDKIDRLAKFTNQDQSYIYAVIFSDKGFDLSKFEALATFATGVYVKSLSAA